MSKSKTNLDALSKQIEALIAKREKELARLKDVITSGLLSDELVTKLGDYSDSDLKKIGKILASKVDDCIAQFEREKAAKRAKPEPKQEVVSEQPRPVQTAPQGQPMNQNQDAQRSGGLFGQR